MQVTHTNDWRPRLCLLLMLAGVGCQNRTGPTAVSQSPRGSYRGELIGQTGKPVMPFVDNFVRVVVTGPALVPAAEVELYRSDFMDQAFKERYHDLAWTSERVIRFARRLTDQARGPDTLNVRNEATQRIRYLRVTAVDLVVLLTLEPSTDTPVSISRQTAADTDYVSVQGEFGDLSLVRKVSKNFPRSREDGAPRVYSVVVRDSETQVSMQPVIKGK